MRKRFFLLLSLLITFCSAALADAYSVNFNTPIATSEHNFAVASNWGHVVGTGNYDGYGPYYMSYSYTADGGFGGTGALCANRQYAGDTWGGTECYDLLVSPVVSGEVTMKVKASSLASGTNPSYVEIYKMDAAGTAYGDLIQRFTVAEGYADIEGEADWKQISLTLAEDQRIGIRAQYVYLDDFTAASAVIVPEKSMTITTAVPSETSGTIYWDQQANGKVLVKYMVTVTNNGEVDLTQGMEDYSVSIFNRKNNTVYVTVPVPQDLAIGATSDEFEVSVEVEPSIWPNSYSYINMDLKENLKGSVVKRTQSGYNAYEPKFVFRTSESTSTVSTTTAQSYGLISEETTRSFELCNLGVAPLTVKSIILPAGFVSANMPTVPAEGLVIEKGVKMPIDITLPVTVQGNFSDNLTIVYLDKENAEKTYTLAFSGNVLPAGTWAADFNSSTTNVGYPAGSIAESGIDSDREYDSGTYNHWLIGRNTVYENNKFITPLLHATAGQQLTFDVKGAYGEAYYAKVYVSTDRKTWGEPVAYFTSADKEGAENIGSSAWVNKSITFDAEGDYYVAFALYGKFGIDNIIGLTKVDVAHDLYFKSINWPDASVKSGTSQVKPSLEVIPLTDEQADAYTVKYVCGETVLAETDAVELTASASYSKTFSFSWTPVAEHTTIYAGSKVVFEFTDGTKFESEPFDLTVTHAPIFHFLNDVPTSKWYEPSDRTAPITFGKTNSNDTQNFVIYNWGPAPLQVKSISLPEGFTTTVEAPLTVAVYDENNLAASAQTLDITFAATESGTYAGDMVITYVDGFGNDATFTLPVSGTMLDPTKFYANFGSESNQWPAGSVYEDNVSTTYVNAGDYALTSSNTTKNMFVTPKLTAAAGDKLLFDAKLYSSYWNDGKVVVYAAATREEVLNTEEGTTRVQLFSVSGKDEENPMTTDYQTFEVTVPEAGSYFFGFEISGRPYVDEIYGLQPDVTVAHDWKVVSSNIPAEAMQNGATKANINILNLGLKDEAAEDYTTTVFVDGKAWATAEGVALPMSHKLSDAGTQIPVTFRYPKTGTFPVYIEVKAGDYSVVSDTVDVTFAEEVVIAEAIEIGTKTGNGRDFGFVDWYNNDGSAQHYTDIVYPAAKLTAAGMKAGDKINQIAFRAFNTSSKNLKAVVTSWVGLSSGEVTLGTPDKEAMTEVSVYNGDVSLPVNFESVINLTSTPLVWDGTSDVRVYTEAVGQGTGNWVNANYDYDEEMTMSYSGTQKAAPLAYFTLAAEAATLSGTVKGAQDSLVVGATLTLVSNDGENVQYTGTTDAEGAYDINVIQSNRIYNVTISAEGYKDSTVVVEMNGASLVQDFVIEPKQTPIIVNPDKDEIVAPEGMVNLIVNGTLAGDDVTSFVAKESPSADAVGATIVAGKGENNSRGIVVKSADEPETADIWNTQFWINFNEALPTGAKLHVEFDYAASKDAKGTTQAHGEPGKYQHWAAIGDVNFTTEWQHFSTDIEVSADMATGQGGKGLKSIAFNLAEEKTATEYYFDNFGVWAEMPAEITWKDIIVNGDMEGSDPTCFFVTEQGVGGPFVATLTDGIGKDNSKAVKVQSADAPANNWDTQFFIRLPYQLPAGTRYKVSFDYKADKVGDFESQSHAEPGQYIHWAAVGSGSFSTEWQTYTTEGAIPSECDGTQADGGFLKIFQTIAFNLALNKTATEFIFDNVKFEVDESIIETLVKNPYCAADTAELVAPDGWTNLIANGNLAGDDVTSFAAKEAPSADVVGARIVAGAGKDYSHGIEVVAPAIVSQAWDSQFWIKLNEPLKEGTKLHVEFDYKADKAVTVGTQAHAAPGDYQHWAAIGDVNFTTEWQHFVADIDVDAAMEKGDNGNGSGTGLLSIAFNLAQENKDVVYNFDNFGVWYQVPVIDGINAAKTEKNAEGVYNLNGQKVMKTQKGLYIKNGRKVVVR